MSERVASSRPGQGRVAASARDVLAHWPARLGVTWDTAFATLFFFLPLSRSILLTALPLTAFERLGSAEAVSFLFLSASLGGIIASLNLPPVVARLGCSGTFHLASLLLISATVALLSDSIVLFALGMVAYLAANTAFDVTLSVYLMQLLPRNELARFEPRRVFAMVAAFCIGPFLGVYMGEHGPRWLPFVATGCVALVTLTYFRLLGLHRVSTSYKADPNPLKNVRRFWGQPRLRLAWSSACARSGFWATLFVYAPILMVSSGLDKVTAGTVMSVSVAMAFAVPLWARVGFKYGLRKLLTIAYAATGIMGFVLWLADVEPMAMALLIIAAAATASMIDGAGNVPFLRAVRGAERAEMAGVYGTFRDVSQLAPPAIAAVVLQFAALPAVFGVVGTLLFGQAYLCKYLPRRM